MYNVRYCIVTDYKQHVVPCLLSAVTGGVVGTILHVSGLKHMNCMHTLPRMSHQCSWQQVLDHGQLLNLSKAATATKRYVSGLLSHLLSVVTKPFEEDQQKVHASVPLQPAEMEHAAPQLLQRRHNSPQHPQPGEDTSLASPSAAMLQPAQLDRASPPHAHLPAKQQNEAWHACPAELHAVAAQTQPAQADALRASLDNTASDSTGLDQCPPHEAAHDSGDVLHFQMPGAAFDTARVSHGTPGEAALDSAGSTQAQAVVAAPVNLLVSHDRAVIAADDRAGSNDARTAAQASFAQAGAVAGGPHGGERSQATTLRAAANQDELTQVRTVTGTAEPTEQTHAQAASAGQSELTQLQDSTVASDRGMLQLYCAQSDSRESDTASAGSIKPAAHLRRPASPHFELDQPSMWQSGDIAATPLRLLHVIEHCKSQVPFG